VKLERVRQYLSAFTTDMENKPYKTVYVDAFAGSGIVTMPKPKKERRGFGLFPVSDAQPCIEGSAVQALRLPVLFKKYYFVERCPQCCSKLSNLIKSQFASLKKRISVECQDANTFLMDYCRFTQWRNRRAVMFLDSFGTVVEWETVKAIAETEAADLLYMFPLGIAVTRLLKCKGDIRPAARATLTRLFGTRDWYREMFKTTRWQGLLRMEEITRRQKGCEVIIKYFLRRLQSAFPHVARNPLKLRNSRGLPMYLLCFATPSKERMEIAQGLFRRCIGSARTGALPSRE
jgi:three-Cys-motif partner protein